MSMTRRRRRRRWRRKLRKKKKKTEKSQRYTEHQQAQIIILTTRTQPRLEWAHYYAVPDKEWHTYIRKCTQRRQDTACFVEESSSCLFCPGRVSDKHQWQKGSHKCVAIHCQHLSFKENDDDGSPKPTRMNVCTARANNTTLYHERLSDYYKLSTFQTTATAV